ncbi:MAG: thioredoxin domain-containing protein [Thermodesulfobacteriota bacterium]
MEKDKKGVNALKDEKSPYLLQHAGNPVNWLPWSEAAFKKAKKEDKPLLVSIGYSTCHWCHVMERESYEDEATARLMNEFFIPVKVDREEHPHVDSLYMKAVQAITGQGGWPLNVFVSPEGTPFFGGTYFPPLDSPGMPSFKTILENVSKAYHENKGRIGELRETLKNSMGAGVESGSALAADESISDGAFNKAVELFDARNGGFGMGMKFPHAMFLMFLLAYYRRTGSDTALAMVDETLLAMARGGLYDQLGGGFHRYTVDERWAVPHFEKMLYDNALLIELYAEAYAITEADAYRSVVEQSVEYLLRDMHSAEGGFYSAEDADVGGVEGTCYIWSIDEVKKVLGAEQGEVFSRYFSMTEGGNFEGANTLRVDPASAEAGEPGAKELSAMREALFARRQKRDRPLRDDKVITAWNGLTISALARAGEVFKRDDWVEAAERAAAFILKTSQDKAGNLARYSIEGAAGPGAVLEDVAIFGGALLDLYRVTGNQEWLDKASVLAEFMKKTFYETSTGLFYDTDEAPEGLFVRERDLFDTDVPSGNSAAAGFLLKIGRVRGDKSDVDLAGSVLASIGTLADESLYHGYALSVLEALLEG